MLLLCFQMETLFPDVSNCKSPISRNYTKRMAPWKERENISVFLKQCKSYVTPPYLSLMLQHTLRFSLILCWQDRDVRLVALLHGRPV